MIARSGALILGDNYRALGIARSLGRRRIETWLVREPGLDVARASRYVRRSLSLPPDRARSASVLLTIADRYSLDGWTLFPTTDEWAAALAREHTTLAARFAMTSPEWEVFRHAYDKRLTDRLAATARVPYPWTRYPRTLEELTAERWPFPVIVKPTVKPQENPLTADKAWRADDLRALRGAWSRATSWMVPEAVMVQERIPGSGETQYSFAALCAGGLPIATLVARRTRQYPREFGHSSSLVETVADPIVEEYGRRIVGELGWSGLIEVEFKRDSRDGSYKLLDLNGRAWTWHCLGAGAGVDFPYLAWRQSHGRRVDPVQARTGVRWIRLTTDLPAAVQSMAARELRPREWLRSLRPPLRPAVLAWDDPRPALVDPLALAQRSMRSAIRELARRLPAPGRGAEPDAGRQETGLPPRAPARAPVGVGASA